MAGQGGFGTVPCGDTTFVPHNCFSTREANAFYSLDLVQPVVHPYELWGPLKDCACKQAQDCWAMGSMVNFNSPFDQPSYLACVYCSTYRALVAFMDTDVKWFDALQLQGLDDERERALKGLNATLAWMQECIVLSG
ncbi:TPA: hypothetical protein ACH3X2_006255 [Trebouxia sp. C0005]